MVDRRGVSNHVYSQLFRSRLETLIEAHEEADTEAGELARLVRGLEQAVTMADKSGVYFNKCPICCSGWSSPETPHHADCVWPDLISNLREV